MTINTYVRVVALALTSLALTVSPASAHKLREKGVEFDVADSNVMVTPARNWNRLDVGVRHIRRLLDHDGPYRSGLRVGHFDYIAR